MSYQIEYREDGTAQTEWKSEHSEIRVSWFKADAQKLFLRLIASDSSALTVLSIDGIRVIESRDQLKFSNPDMQFMQDILLPKSFGLFLCKHHNIQIEDCPYKNSIQINGNHVDESDVTETLKSIPQIQISDEQLFAPVEHLLVKAGRELADLDGGFTATQLEAIAQWMRSKEK